MQKLDFSVMSSKIFELTFKVFFFKLQQILIQNVFHSIESYFKCIHYLK